MDDALSIAQSLGLVEPDEDALTLLEMVAKAAEGKIWAPATGDDIVTTHTFGGGLYARTAHAKRPTLLTSRVHLTEHLYCISLGACYVWTPGGGVKVQVAHHLEVTKPGTFRLVWVPEECICTTFHHTDETDPVKIFEQTTALPSFMLT